MKSAAVRKEQEFSDMQEQARPYSSSEIYDLDYARGMQDCEKGIPHEHKSDAYTEGYNFQYAYEQASSARSR